MKFAIVVNSKTGNTKKLAQSIKDRLTNDECVFMGSTSEMNNINNIDILFVGFWTDINTCDDDMKEYLHTLKNTKIFLFGTSGASNKDEYQEHVLRNVKENIDKSNKIVGEFMCQGKMPIEVREKYETVLKKKPDDKRIMAMINLFDEALMHPNNDDLVNLGQKIDEAIKCINE